MIQPFISTFSFMFKLLCSHASQLLSRAAVGVQVLQLSQVGGGCVLLYHSWQMVIVTTDILKISLMLVPNLYQVYLFQKTNVDVFFSKSLFVFFNLNLSLKFKLKLLGSIITCVLWYLLQ